MKRFVLASTTLNEYKYKGHPKRFDEFGIDLGLFEVETTAPTLGRAKSNILFKIKQNLGLAKTAKVYIDEKEISMIPSVNYAPDAEDTDVKDVPTTPQQLSLFD